MRAKLVASRQACADELRDARQARQEADRRLHELLLRIALEELDRRRDMLPPGAPAADVLAREAASAAMAAISALTCPGAGQERFVIWAAKFAIAEVSAKVARCQWHARPVPADQEQWERLPWVLGLRPGDKARYGATLAALRLAADEDLSSQQRSAFLAVAVGGMPPDVVALALGSTRNGVYKALFEARRLLQHRLAAGGLGPGRPHEQPFGWPPRLAGLLAVSQADAGCEITFQELDAYVDLELQGRDPTSRLAAIDVHLRNCGPCYQDYLGLRVACSPLAPGPGMARADSLPGRAQRPASRPDAGLAWHPGKAG